MTYEDGQTIVLGDVVKIELHDGDHIGRIIMMGDTGKCSGIDDSVAQWARESGHVGKNNIMLEWIEPNPLAHDDPKYSPVSNTLSTCLCGVVLVRREENESQQSPEADSLSACR